MVSSRNRTNFILIFILASLGLYLYFYEREGARGVPETRRIERIFDFKAEDIQEIMLRWKGKAIFFKKEKGQWMIKEPMKTPADNEKINYILSFFDYGIVDAIDANPSDYDQYGLVQPEIEWGIKGKGETAFRILLIGNNNPNNTSCYARVKGESRVLIIGGAYKSGLQKEAPYFRLQQ
ncbi:MAG TPA: DUF4340 domain-containing protein [Syntrophales bacterium]|nr:DUF4340 domain-containing protein [Syntrophales bacterium]